MRVTPIDVGFAPGEAAGHGETRARQRIRPQRAERGREDRQLERMLVAGFLLFLVPATIAGLTRWRWSPWPAGSEGRRSIVGEARAAAEVYVPLGFTSW